MFTGSEGDVGCLQGVRVRGGYIQGGCGVSTGSEGVGCLQGVRVWGVYRECITVNYFVKLWYCQTAIVCRPQETEVGLPQKVVVERNLEDGLL